MRISCQRAKKHQFVGDFGIIPARNIRNLRISRSLSGLCGSFTPTEWRISEHRASRFKVQFRHFAEHIWAIARDQLSSC